MKNMIVLIILICVSACSPVKNKESRAKVLSARLDSIIGGKDVPDSSPIIHFTVALYDKKNHFVCTGSLISENIVLTAAHCLDTEAANIVVVFGLDFSAFDSNDTKFLRSATAVKVHPDYNAGRTSDLDWNDIALVQFEGSVPPGYAPIEILQEASLLKATTPVQMAGYGASAVSFDEVTAKKDKKFQQAVGDGEIVCYDKTFSHCYEITFSGTDRLRLAESNIEGFTEKEIRINEAKGQGTCVGDSGGPLLFQSAEKFFLIGITSRGSQFCDGPAIYTNALKYSEWLYRSIDRVSKKLN